MKRQKTFKRAFGSDEYGFPEIPGKYSGTKLSRLLNKDVCCTWCFPHGYENRNSHYHNLQKTWKVSGKPNKCYFRNKFFSINDTKINKFRYKQYKENKQNIKQLNKYYQMDIDNGEFGGEPASIGYRE